MGHDPSDGGEREFCGGKEGVFTSCIGHPGCRIVSIAHSDYGSTFSHRWSGFRSWHGVRRNRGGGLCSIRPKPTHDAMCIDQERS